MYADLGSLQTLLPIFIKKSRSTYCFGTLTKDIFSVKKSLSIGCTPKKKDFRGKLVLPLSLLWQSFRVLYASGPFGRYSTLTFASFLFFEPN
jgi:hypothetical protein